MKLTAKLEKTVREIDRARAKISELQALLPELERQRTELENAEIVRVVRDASVAPRDLEAFLRAIRPGASPNITQTEAPDEN